ncbi:hypothetical protein TEHAL1_22350 [Tetragenococcus halophilus]|uniref:hypothetical protein n=1 Tax=Tetragenococcus halophilus TaxID=51669 RepID=UPI00256B99A5|nr:hypothetical protein [Tetragenococcus halophilus]GMG64760.1 hypothetical protein TEHAL1_22350 [Tetragenococcus halophilus]
MSKNYARLENKVLSLFIENEVIKYKDKEFLILSSGKPRARKGGEPKTDCYIKLQNTYSKEILEYKISCKLKSSNEFQENKVKAERAKEILGPNWEDIISSNSQKIDHIFKSLSLNNPNGLKRNKNGHIVLGWKLEIATKPRTLSSKLNLSEEKIKDYIYKGINQEEEKRDSFINKIKIKNSGIANYILITEINDINKAEDVLDKAILINEYEIKPHYLIFTANTYNIQKNKTDGNRPLAVRIEWELTDSKLYPNIKYNSPLTEPSKSKNMKKIIDDIFREHPSIKDQYI